MRPLDVLGFAIGATRGRKLRTALTTLGVVIGIAAIVSLLSLSQGLQVSVTDQLQSGLATDTLVVTPLDPSTPTLQIGDTAPIEAIDGVALAVPVVQGLGQLSVNGSTLEVEVLGIDFDKYRAVYGRLFVSHEGVVPNRPSDDDVVVGYAVHNPGQNGSVFARPGDEGTVTWVNTLVNPPADNHYEGRVVGVLREIGALGAGGLSDTAIYVPLAKAAELFGTTGCSLMLVKLENDQQSTVDSATAAIKGVFNDQVRVSSPKGVHELVSGVFSTLDLFLIGVASISLMVAGVGIMNVMMVSLLERRREIGVLKALGMKDRTVLAIFLCEAGIMGVAGGLLGAVLGFSSASLIAYALGSIALPAQLGAWAASGITIAPALDPEVFVGAVLFGVLISLAFALYPAWRSLRLTPVDSLRYE